MNTLNGQEQLAVVQNSEGHQDELLIFQLLGAAGLCADTGSSTMGLEWH